MDVLVRVGIDDSSLAWAVCLYICTHIRMGLCIATSGYENIHIPVLGKPARPDPATRLTDSHITHLLPRLRMRNPRPILALHAVKPPLARLIESSHEPLIEPPRETQSDDASEASAAWSCACARIGTPAD